MLALALLCILLAGGCASGESGQDPAPTSDVSDYPELPLSYLDTVLDGSISALAVSPDGGLLVAGTEGGEITCMDDSGRIIWETVVETGAPVRISTGPGGRVTVVSTFGTTPAGDPMSCLTVLDAEGRQLWTEQAPVDCYLEVQLADDGTNMMIGVLPWNTGEAEIRFVDPLTGVATSRFAFPPVGDGRIDASPDLQLAVLSLADAGDGLSAPDGRTVIFVEGEQSVVVTDSPCAVSSVAGLDAVASLDPDGHARVMRMSSAGWATDALSATVRAPSKLAATEECLAVVSLMKQEAGDSSRQVIEVSGLDLLTGDLVWTHSFVDDSRRRPLSIAEDTLMALLDAGASDARQPLVGLLISVNDGAILRLPAESRAIGASPGGESIVIGMSDGRLAVSH